MDFSNEAALAEYHRMQAKRYLSIVRSAQFKIEVSLDEIASIRETMSITGSSALDDMPHNPNANSDAVLNAVLAIEDRCSKLQQRVDEYRRITSEADDIISSLESHHLASAVVSYYYIQGWTWKEIASKYNKSMSHLKSYVVNKALEEVYQKMPPQYRDQIPSAY